MGNPIDELENWLNNTFNREIERIKGELSSLNKQYENIIDRINEMGEEFWDEQRYFRIDNYADILDLLVAHIERTL